MLLGWVLIQPVASAVLDSNSLAAPDASLRQRDTAAQPSLCGGQRRSASKGCGCLARICWSCWPPRASCSAGDVKRPALLTGRLYLNVEPLGKSPCRALARFAVAPAMSMLMQRAVGIVQRPLARRGASLHWACTAWGPREPTLSPPPQQRQPETTARAPAAARCRRRCLLPARLLPARLAASYTVITGDSGDNGGPATSWKLVIYSKEGCHLCEGLKEKVEVLLERAAFLPSALRWEPGAEQAPAVARQDLRHHCIRVEDQRTAPRLRVEQQQQQFCHATLRWPVVDWLAAPPPAPPPHPRHFPCRLCVSSACLCLPVQRRGAGGAGHHQPARLGGQVRHEHTRAGGGRCRRQQRGGCT